MNELNGGSFETPEKRIEELEKKNEEYRKKLLEVIETTKNLDDACLDCMCWHNYDDLEIEELLKER